MPLLPDAERMQQAVSCAPQLCPGRCGVLALIHFFIDLCLLRRAPQDLPASRILLGLMIVLGLGASTLLSVTAGARVGLALSRAALDFALALSVLAAALRWTGKAARFIQTATALLGADILLGLLALLPLTLANAAATAAGVLFAAALYLALLLWSILVAAHILRHAFAIHLMWAAFAVVVYEFIAFVLISDLLPPPD